MFNKIILLGRFTKDFDVRYTASGTGVYSTTIAVNRRYKNKSGEQVEEVVFIDVTFFGKTGEIADKFCGKGSKVLIEGRLAQDNWKDSNGNSRSKLYIVGETIEFLDDGNNGGSGGGRGKRSTASQGSRAGRANNGGGAGNAAADQSFTDFDGSNDEIPF